LSYLPKSETHIGKVYKVLSSEFVSAPDLRSVLENRYPNFPSKSLHVHLKFLIKKTLIEKKKISGEVRYRKCETSNNLITSEPVKSMTSLILAYLKSHIGKKITGRELVNKIYKGKESSLPFDILSKLGKAKYIQVVSGSSPREYLVLPAIKTLDKIPAKLNPINSLIPAKSNKEEKVEQIKTTTINITDMSIGEILTDYMYLKEENSRLKDSLQRIANEVLLIGEIGESK